MRSTPTTIKRITGGAIALAAAGAFIAPGIAAADTTDAGSLSSLSALSSEDGVDTGSLDTLIGSLECFGPHVPQGTTEINDIAGLIGSLSGLSGLLNGCS